MPLRFWVANGWLSARRNTSGKLWCLPASPVETIWRCIGCVSYNYVFGKGIQACACFTKLQLCVNGNSIGVTMKR